MATCGEARITSNGCPTAVRVPRRGTGFREKSDNIAAIDFGTTNCSLAYITAGDSFEEGPKRLPLNTSHYRVPTAILFTPDGSIDSFGYDARTQHFNLEDDQLLTYAYFEQIKMDFQHDENVSREMRIKASNGTEYFLVDVIAQILKYLKNELIENYLKRAGIPLEATDLDWVVTVPAIWKARGKQMMREAGYKAGLCSEVDCRNLQPASRVSSQLQPTESKPDKLTLALKPECASIFCQNMPQQSAAPYCKADYPFKSSSFLVVDIGGETIDISAHCISSSANTEVVHPPTGNDCGGSRVNKEFKKFLGDLVNDPRFLRYLNTGNLMANAKHNTDLNELVDYIFEAQKMIFCRQEPSLRTLSFKLPYTFLTVYAADIQRGLHQHCRSQVQMSGQYLRISYAQMEKFMKPVVDGLLSCMATTLHAVEPKVEAIYIVGGFGGCKYISTAIAERFGSKYRYIVPAEPDFAVVRGAVLYRRIPELVHARRVDATYGTDASIRYDPSIHEKEYKFTDDDGIDRCDHIFCTIVERGDITDPEFVYTTSYTPLRHNENSMTFCIYSSPDKDVWYTTGKRGKGRSAKPAKVWNIGDVRVDMPVLTGDKSRRVDIMFDFSHTEIQVKGYDRMSGNEVKVVLDFLSATTN